MSHLAKLLLPACVCLTLYGCGQRGPLYLPDKNITEAGTTEAGPTEANTPHAGQIPGSETERPANTTATDDDDDSER